MKRLFFFVIMFFSYSCKTSAQELTNLQKKIFSKKYSLEFLINRILLDSAKIGARKKIYGQIKRDNDYIYSKSSLGTGIFQDSLCLYIDKINKIANLNDRYTLSPILVIMFYDPLEIFRYAIEHSNSYHKIVEGIKLKHDYKVSVDSIPAKQILIIENKNNNSFVIEFTYQSLTDTIKDIITYKILPDSTHQNTRNIKDFIQKRNDKFVLRPELKGYRLYDFTPLESMFKRK